jgi:cell wall-associated NlpC family hydrolase
MVSISPIRKMPDETSEMISQLLFGEPVEIIHIKDNWCKIRTIQDLYEGYTDLKQLFLLSESEKNKWLSNYQFQRNKTLTIKGKSGLFITLRGSFISNTAASFKIGEDNYEIINFIDDRQPNLIDLAANYLNTPYLWGGKSPFGIDCSGFVQAVFRFYNIMLPRDAKDQFLFGKTVEFKQIKEGDVAFFKNEIGKISHVGILDGRNKIIHASGWVKWDHFGENGITNIETGSLTHKLEGIRRFII